MTDLVATLKAKVELLEAELAAEQQRSAGHRADYERERDRADRMVTTQDRLVTELEGLRRLLAAAQEAAWPGHPPEVARDDLARAGALAALDRLKINPKERPRNEGDHRRPIT